MQRICPLTKYSSWSIMKRNIRRQKDLKSGPQVNLKIESNRDMAGLDAVS